MKYKVLCLALSLVASACVTSTENPAESAESPNGIREQAFGFHHENRIQYQVRSTTHGPNSTTLEIFVANGRRKLVLGSNLQFALATDGKRFVSGQSELPWIFENYQTLWVEFPIVTTVDSDLSLEITTGEETGELSVSRAVPELPTQIDPLTEPLLHGVQLFGPTTFELRSIAFGESSISALMFAANQTALPMSLGLDSRLVDDLGNVYSMMPSPNGEYFAVEPRAGAVVSASFAGRIHPDATRLTLVIDDVTKPLVIENLNLDMAQGLVPQLPSENKFDGDVEIWLMDDLGNRHEMMLPKSKGDLFYEVDAGAALTGAFRFAGGVSPNAQRLSLFTKQLATREQLVSEITLTRVGEPSEPDPVLIRRFSRYAPVSFGESTATSELLEALATEVDQGVVELELPDNVLFEFAKSDLLAEGVAVLADVAELLGRSPKSTISITGHTDGIGTAEANLALSLDRAETVRQQLVEVHGIDRGRLTVQGLGESQPVASEFNAAGADSPGGRARNRRTEIRIDGFNG